jgi:hypothetical protein
MPECWFASLPGAGPCDGRLRRCHLIPKNTLKNEFRWGVVRVGSVWEKAHPVENPAWERRDLFALQTDRRCWVYGCGGPMGQGGHHGAFKPDGPRPVPRGRLPEGLEEFAAELGLVWWLDRTYGEAT